VLAITIIMLRMITVKKKERILAAIVAAIVDSRNPTTKATELS